jgi:hypothetical protein
MEVDTRGSGFDTVVGVYTGATVGSLVEMASNNDRGTNRQARVWFPAAAGATYHVAVDGVCGEEGSVVLGIRPVVAPVIEDVTIDSTNSIQVVWDSVPGENYRVGFSTNLQGWSCVTSLVASRTCFSRVERYLDP